VGKRLTLASEIWRVEISVEGLEKAGSAMFWENSAARRPTRWPGEKRLTWGAHRCGAGVTTEVEAA
jgi:hypothetical protein